MARALGLEKGSLTKTGKSVVITMDHGVDLGPLEGLENPDVALFRVLSGEYKPDAILMNPSMIRLNYAKLAGEIGVIAHLDGTAAILGPDIADYRLFSSVGDALRIGANA